MNTNTIGQIEILEEIKRAEAEGRPADFSNKVISDFSISIERIKLGLNFENSKITGQLFLGEIIINGDLNLKNTEVNGSIYLGKSDIKGNLILENSKINGAINLVGAKVSGNVMARDRVVNGFVSLTKAEVNGNAVFEAVKIDNANYEDLTVRGDLFFDTAIIKGSLNLSKIIVDGSVDLDDAEVEGDLVLTGAMSKKGEIDTTMAKIKGRKII
ncbi:MAG: hypothetical protein PHD31_01125 [Candidatus Pacebacteria bacterium]|nr:hypothetical protein [Candidatus Paceibacterota bacterium]